MNDLHTELMRTLKRQRQAFLREGAPDLQDRRRALKALKTATLARRGAFQTALSADFGHRSRHETDIMELAGLVQGIDFLHRNLRRFMRAERRRVGLYTQLGRARVEYQPLGIVGIIVPWNYPVALSLMPLATALAAGNRVMIKPSEFMPQTNAVLKEVLSEVFAEEQVAMVEGDVETGVAFSALPFDHLFFTGSTTVGKKVMAAASANLVPVTLELGGKSPVIIERGHALDHAAAGIAFGKLVSGGQTCIAPDYALVHTDDLERFVTEYDATVARFYPDGPTSQDYTSIISDRHFARLEGLLSDAEAHGATIRVVGRPGTATGYDNAPRKLPPTLVLNVTPEMRIAQEEIFGPLLPIFTYRQIEEAIAHVNAGPRPLALYYFGKDKAQQRQILDWTISGNVTINGTIMHVAQDALPFGGVGASGMGAYHGIEGFRTFSHARGIYEQHRWNSTLLLRAPYGKLTDRLLRVILR